MNDNAPKVWYPTAKVRSTSRFICIETESAGLTDPKGKQHLLSPEASEGVIGLAVLDALAHSRQMTPLEAESLMWGRHGTGQERYEKWSADLQQKYGYKSSATLFKNMKLCGVKQQNTELVFTPMAHVKLQAWQSDKDIKNVLISSGSLSEKIGNALKLALTRCY